MTVIRKNLASIGLDTDRGGMPRPRLDNSNARAIESLGSAVSGLGNALAGKMAAAAERKQQQEEKRQRFEAEAEYDKLQIALADDAKSYEDNAALDGAGLHDNFMQESFQKRAQSFLSGLPEGELRDRFSTLIGVDHDKWSSNIARRELDRRHGYFRSTIAEQQRGLLTAIDQNPSNYGEFFDRGNRLLNESGLFVGEKAEEIRKWRDSAQGALLARMVQDDPESVRRALGGNIAPHARVSGKVVPKNDVAQVVATAAERYGVDPATMLGIAQIESALNPRAKATTSTASGLFQFIKGTAKRYGLRNVFDAGENADAGARFTRDNIAYLQRRLGRAPSPGETYLAHFLGTGAAGKLLSADGGSAASNHVSAAAVRANRSILAGKTVSQVKAWADRKMGKAMANAAGVKVSFTEDTQKSIDPRFEGIDPDMRLKALAMADAQELNNQKDMAAAASADYTARKDAYDLAITQGGVAEENILNDPVLDDGDKASLVRKLRTSLNEDRSVSDLLQRMTEGGDTARINPFDADERKVGDKAYAAIIDRAADEDKPLATKAYVEKTGYVPKQFTAEIRQGLNSGDVKQVVEAMQKSAWLMDTAKPALEGIEHGRDIKDAGILWQSYLNRGIPIERGAQMLIDSQQPDEQQKRARLSEPVKEFVKTLSVSDVTNEFDSVFTWEPAAGLNEDQKSEMFTDYIAFAREAYFRLNGDAEAAKLSAMDSMKHIYGVSTASGTKTLFKFPPEHFYPQIGGSHDYIRDEMLAAAKSVYPDAEDVILGWSSETALDVQAGRLPRYPIYYRRKNGAYDTVPPGGFMIEPERIKEIRMQTIEVAREKAAVAVDAQQELFESALPLKQFFTGPVGAGPARPMRSRVDESVKGTALPFGGVR